MKPQTMNEVILAAFRKTINFLRLEVEVMPLSRWNESVLRYFFCCYIATSYPNVKQFIECDRIDLVLKYESQVAFIEFKFYKHSRRFDPYDERILGYKGGPGRQNLREFQACIDQLHKRPSKPYLSKYFVLVYVDPTDGSKPLSRFSNQYSDYQHPNKNVMLCLIESSEQIVANNDIIQAKLYDIGVA